MSPRFVPGFLATFALAALAAGQIGCGGAAFNRQSPPVPRNDATLSTAAVSGNDTQAPPAADGGPAPAPGQADADAPLPNSQAGEISAETRLFGRAAPSVPEPSRVGRYEVIELSFPYPSAGLANPWEDVTVTAAFRTPAGRLIMTEGFYYDADDYRVRFAPADLGEYQYSVDIRGRAGNTTQSGAFSVTNSAQKGFIRKLEGNPYRMVFDDGSIANGIGLGDCWAKTGALNGSVDAGKAVNLETYLGVYGPEGAGFNVFRWNPGNCSFDIYDSLSTTGNTYLARESKWADRLLGAAHAHGFHVMFTFFHTPPDPRLEDAYKRAVRYVMARYGAYTDIWELTNETEEKLPISFLQVMTAYVKQLDPNKRIVTNSYPRPGDWTVLDARSPHLQIEKNDGVQDMRVVTKEFTTNKPVIAGELYNPGNRNWDTNSAQRMRMYAWTAFMGGMIDVWWNTSYKRPVKLVPGNMYIGEDERRAVQVLQKLSAHVPPTSQLATLAVSGGQVTGYALASSSSLLAYLYRPFGAAKAAATFTLEVPTDGVAVFIDPASGATLQKTSLHRGTHAFTTPAFAQDVVLQLQ